MKKKKQSSFFKSFKFHPGNFSPIRKIGLLLFILGSCLSGRAQTSDSVPPTQSQRQNPPAGSPRQPQATPKAKSDSMIIPLQPASRPPVNNPINQVNPAALRPQDTSTAGGDSTQLMEPPVSRIIQYSSASIHSDFVLAPRRASFKKYLLEKTIQETFSGPLNQNTDYKFENACLSATQFLIKNQYSQRGFDKMFEQYFRLDASTRQALMTAVYGIYPATYREKIKSILPFERDPKIFAIGVLYDYRLDSSIGNKNRLLSQMRRQFADSYQNVILRELTKYLQQHLNQQKTGTPPILELFRYQQLWKQKTVYSFQRWDRNYSGLCIVQYEDGHFARDEQGKLKTFRQLARSGSGLPYFITNGNTPQGVYRIAGSRVSIDKLIGPTPTLQSVLPFQSDGVFYRDLPHDSAGDPLDNFKMLLPPAWQSYPPMQESFYAGKAGRSYIVIHGSTLDASFFDGWAFYPNSPTDGCLSTLESWDTGDGSIIHSDQLDLVNTFHKTASYIGLLEVINLDNQKKNVTEAEINALVDKFEKSRPASSQH